MALKRLELDLRRDIATNHKVTMVELYFDLVFVFAITQLSHTLLQKLGPMEIYQTLLLLLAVWWVWVFTSWVTNWLNPDYYTVRLMLFALMLAGIVVASALPKAFGDRGLHFALAFAAMQVGRSAFALWAFTPHDGVHKRNFQRLTLWMVLSSLFWIAGGLATPAARLVWWTLAIAIEYTGPVMRFYVPGLGSSQTRDWQVSAEHMAERCGLFIIIALGESILITGATFAGLAWTAATVAAFVIAFVGSGAMWWIYFNIGAEEASHRFAHAEDTGRMARLAYTYLHLPIVAGIVVMAAGDELSLAHPVGHTDVKTAATVIGGPALFILGNILFKRSTAVRWPLSHLVGLALLGLSVFTVPYVWPVVLAGLVMAILVLIAVWESLSLRATKQRMRTAHGHPVAP